MNISEVYVSFNSPTSLKIDIAAIRTEDESCNYNVYHTGVGIYKSIPALIKGKYTKYTKYTSTPQLRSSEDQSLTNLIFFVISQSLLSWNTAM